MAVWRIEPLTPAHERGEFSSGEASLDDFLRSRATQYEKRNLGRTYVAVLPDDLKVHGYYTLASGSVPVPSLPAKIAKKLPKHPVPVALLGRLAVDQAAQGHKLGGLLLLDALRRCLDISRTIGIYGLEVIALNEQAKAFYLKFGFEPLTDHALHLHMSTKTIETLFADDKGS